MIYIFLFSKYLNSLVKSQIPNKKSTTNVTYGFHHPETYLDNINGFPDVKIRKQT